MGEFGVNLRAAIREMTDPMSRMRRVVEQACSLIAAAEGAVVEVMEGGELIWACASGSLAAHVGKRIDPERSLSGLAVRTGLTLRCNDADIDDRVDPRASATTRSRSMVCVPLLRRGDPVGVLAVTASRPHAFSDVDVAVLAQLAQFVTTLFGALADLSRSIEALPLGSLSECVSSVSDDVIGAFVADVLRPGMSMDLVLRERIARLIEQGAFTVVCQPIFDLATGDLVGAEALARFPGTPPRSPESWFEDAQREGLVIELELAAVEKALTLLDRVPRDAYLAINVGPQAMCSPRLAPLLEVGDPRRVVLELTEHLSVEDYARLQRALERIRATGVRLAIDDTGAGFAGLTHMLRLAPDIIKLDRELTRGIHGDPVRRALAGALVTFAKETGVTVVAEGIETPSECSTVRHLGIPHGQGFLLGRPGPASALTSAGPTRSDSACAVQG